MNRESVGLIGGTGEEGRGIALRLASAGIEVNIGSRSLTRARETAAELGQLRLQGRIMGVENGELPSRSAILFLAVPFKHAREAIIPLCDLLTDEHVVIDVTVPVVFQKGPRFVDLQEGSGTEYLRRWIPAHVPLVAAFKTLPAHLLADASLDLDCDEFICSDSPQASARVLRTLQRIDGIRWIEAGPLRFCKALEAMTVLVIGINQRYKIRHGRFRVLGL